jgi:hypothetical protein
MCVGGTPKAAPAPAQAAPVTSAAPEFAADAYDNETASETSNKQKMGKRDLKIARNRKGSDLNIPGATPASPTANISGTV